MKMPLMKVRRRFLERLNLGEEWRYLEKVSEKVKDKETILRIYKEYDGELPPLLYLIF